jgi:hypothetical protein
VAGPWAERVRTLLEAPSPAVLTTYRKDGSAFVSPVWFRWAGGVFEVVIAEGDVKLRHLARDPRCILVVFESVPPFRGVEARGVPELVEGEMTPVRERSPAATSESNPADDSLSSVAPSPASCCDWTIPIRASGTSRRSCRNESGFSRG